MLFEASDAARLFAEPPGRDFPSALLDGLFGRCEARGLAPHEVARVTIIVNTGRMQRRMREYLDAGPPRLLPKIRLLTDLSDLAPAQTAERRDPLRLRLDLCELVRGLMSRLPDLASDKSA